MSPLLPLLLALGQYGGYATPNYVQQQVFGIPVQPNYYYSVGNADQVQHIADEVVRRLLEADPAPPTLTRDHFHLGGPPLFSEGESVRQVFVQSCMSCHDPGASKPGVPLLTEDEQLFRYGEKDREQARRERIYQSVASHKMPKKARPLPLEQIQLIERWAKGN